MRKMASMGMKGMGMKGMKSAIHTPLNTQIPIMTDKSGSHGQNTGRGADKMKKK